MPRVFWDKLHHDTEHILLYRRDGVEATDWERYLSHGRLSPTQTERAVAPERVLKIVSCGCRVACSKRGKSRKARLYCTTICSFCIGQITVTARMIKTEPKAKQL